MDAFDFIMENLWVAWLVVAGILLFVEVETTALVSLWFVIGAVIAAIVAVFYDNIIIQLVVFFVCSIISLFIFKKFYKGKLKPQISGDVEYSPVGKVAIACDEITSFNGKVKLDDVYWKAVSKDGEIAVGEQVKIVAVAGTTLTVERKM